MTSKRRSLWARRLPARPAGAHDVEAPVVVGAALAGSPRRSPMTSKRRARPSSQSGLLAVVALQAVLEVLARTQRPMHCAAGLCAAVALARAVSAAGMPRAFLRGVLGKAQAALLLLPAPPSKQAASRCLLLLCVVDQMLRLKASGTSTTIGAAIIGALVLVANDRWPKDGGAVVFNAMFALSAKLIAPPSARRMRQVLLATLTVGILLDVAQAARRLYPAILRIALAIALAAALCRHISAALRAAAGIVGAILTAPRCAKATPLRERWGIDAAAEGCGALFHSLRSRACGDEVEHQEMVEDDKPGGVAMLRRYAAAGLSVAAFLVASTRAVAIDIGVAAQRVASLAAASAPSGCAVVVAWAVASAKEARQVVAGSVLACAPALVTLATMLGAAASWVVACVLVVAAAVLRMMQGVGACALAGADWARAAVSMAASHSIPEESLHCVETTKMLCHIFAGPPERRGGELAKVYGALSARSATCEVQQPVKRDKFMKGDEDTRDPQAFLRSMALAVMKRCETLGAMLDESRSHVANALDRSSQPPAFTGGPQRAREGGSRGRA
eukprot:CAMPEP_0176128170 /NCGR_PEP_ID=MMETSP0120_2-20121206/64759_1 /TAXON_ID=160619 /ORGANISM="Kryptoperidinium foliaceum, Strain CCMP 1326" /LENGTH=560 /DNA_ID=CAMNT_0017463251 /DNA_START=9 /DNA_END=1690 /DNA_ORIENTATION=+